MSSDTKELPKLKSLEQFLFEIPLYEPFEISLEDGHVSLLFSYGEGPKPVDGHCPYCGRQSTFTVRRASYLPTTLSDAGLLRKSGHYGMNITCVRDESHRVTYSFRKQDSEVQKIGQFPSLADIANDEVSALRKTMQPVDARELHKAIGLAAHGVGVGSFVYLRRVFERLIYKRFEEVKAQEGWKDEDFYKSKMEDKIKTLSNHLPNFLVKNRKIYSILSVGVHELDEKQCLSWFGVMKKSIQIILEDDAKKREEAKTRDEFAGLIAGFKGLEAPE